MINKLVQDEMYHMIYKKSSGTETKNTKSDIINILDAMIKELQNSGEVKLRRLQNMIRHINLMDDLVNVLLKRLIYKEFSYNDLFLADQTYWQLVEEIKAEKHNGLF